MILGIDEAGKGPVIGPLVISFFSCLSSNYHLVKEIAKKDSKKYSKLSRKKKYEELKNLGFFQFSIISAKELTKLMKNHTINEIEVQKICEKIKNKKYDRIVIDMFDTNKTTFLNRFKRYKIDTSNIIAEHKADENWPEVSAASIGAKVVRDEIIKKLNKKLGFFGSGYPSDPTTIEFLKNKKNLIKAKEYIRWKWKTLKNLYQTKLI